MHDSTCKFITTYAYLTSWTESHFTGIISSFLSSAIRPFDAGTYFSEGLIITNYTFVAILTATENTREART